MQVNRSHAPTRFAYSGGGLNLPRTHLLMPQRNRQDGSNLHDIILVWIKYWRWIAGSCLIGLIGAVLFLFSVQTLYTSSVSILIDAYARSGLSADTNAIANATPDPNMVESQLKILSSPAVLKRVITNLNLDQDSEFIGSNADHLSLDVRAAKAIAALSKKMIIKKSERTYVIDIELLTSKPDKSAQIANAIAEAYLADQNETQNNSSKRDRIAVSIKLSQQQNTVRDAYTLVQKFKQDNHISDVNGKLLNEQEFLDLTAAANLARNKTRDLKARTEQWQKYLNSGHPLQARPEGLQSGTLERLWANYADIIKQQGNFRTTLGDRHPALQEVETQLRDIRRLIDNEMRAIIQSAQSEYQIAQANEKDLNRRLEESKMQNEKINVLLIRLKELERNAEAEKQVYDRLLKVRDTLGSDSDEGSWARIIATATPALESSYPKPIPILAISLAIGLFASAGGVLFKDFIDSVKSPDSKIPKQTSPSSFMRVSDTSRQAHPSSMRQPWVVGVPDVKLDELDATDDMKSLYAMGQREIPTLRALMTASASFPQSYFTNAIDQVRDLILQSWSRLKKEDVKTILVTSRIARAGKTSLCTNLSIRLSLVGLRVVIVDTDSHNSDLAKLISETAEPSLISLSGHTRLIYSVRLGSGLDISIVPILNQEEQIIRRLQKKQSRRMMSGFKRNFDVVIIDGPEFTEQSSLDQFAKSVDHVIVALDGQREDPSQIDLIEEQLKSSQIHLSGFVISKMRAG